jgi:hypothetical protein
MSEVGYKKPPVEHRFKKGNKLGGKTKGAFSLKNLLRAEIQKCPAGQDKKTWAVLIIQRMLADSVKKGDIQHIRTIFNYLEGMPKQELDPNSQVLVELINYAHRKENKSAV